MRKGYRVKLKEPCNHVNIPYKGKIFEVVDTTKRHFYFYFHGCLTKGRKDDFEIYD